MRCIECQYENPSGSLMCERCQEKLYHAKLRITRQNGDHDTHFLFPQRYTIGRGMENAIIIRDTSVSRKHAEIDFIDGCFIIIDNESKNGSLLNDHHFKTRKLHDLDCIQLGNVVLHFYDERNRLLHHRKGFDTAEWVQQEFFKYTKDGQANITTDDLLLTMLDLAMSLIHAEQAMVLQFDDAKRLRFKIGKQQGERTIFGNNLTDFDWHVINSAIRKNAPEVVYRESYDDGTREKLVDVAFWHKLAIPLVSANIEDKKKRELGIDGILGVVFFNHSRKSDEIPARKRQLLSTIVQQIMFAIENEFLYEQAVEKKRIDRELSLAKEIQKKLLPAAGLKLNRLEIASFIHPCEAVSGDYFDLVQISPRRIAIAIGDICGKGVPAALLTSTVQAAIHSQLEYTKSPEQIINNLNRLLIRNTAESIFLTLFFGILELNQNRLTYINAGHPPPIVVRKDLQMTELGGTTPALGIFEGKFDSERTIELEPGDMLLLYTDGIIESQNREKKIYGRKRLLKHVEKLLSRRTPIALKPDLLVNSIAGDLVEFIDNAKQNDDLTLLAVRRRLDSEAKTNGSVTS